MNKLTTILIAVALVPVITAYADHVDNYIWIETADGGFVTATESTTNKINEITRTSIYGNEYYGTVCDMEIEIEYEYEWNREYTNQQTGIQTDTSTAVSWNEWPSKWNKPTTTTVNNINMINQREGQCGNNEENYINTITPKLDEISNNLYDNYYAYDYEYFQITKIHTPFKEYHECVCGYWYSNAIQDEYTYTIIDLPRDRELPPNYKQIVSTGVQAGLDRWGEINDIDFIHTDSRLQADIIIQQQIGNGKAYGNAVVGCLFDEEQCTIQLFTDINTGWQQTLVNTHSIEWTIAHEFGHLIGLPHHIEPDHIMNTVHANDVRDYYEARNINVPRMTEPTHEQRLLENDNDYLDYANYIPTDIDGIMRHSAVTEFIEFMKAVMYNMTESDRASLWTGMMGLLTDAIFS